MNKKYFAINVIDRHFQTPQRYVEVFRKLVLDNKAVKLRGERHISLDTLNESALHTRSGVPQVMYGRIDVFDFLDENAFYNKKEKEIAEIKMDPNIVANRKYTDYYFVPEAHRLIFHATPHISALNVEKLLTEACNSAFGIDKIEIVIEKDRNVIDQILNAPIIEKINAKLTYSNRDSSIGFEKLLDEKANESNISIMNINLHCAPKEQLNVEKDGLVESILNLSQSNGEVEAVIRESSKHRRMTIKTKEFPRKIELDKTDNNILSSVYNTVMSIFRNKSNE